MWGKKNIRIHYFGYWDWQKKTDKFYLHMQKGPVCKRHFSTWKYFGQNQLRIVEEKFNIKNKANTNNIKLVLCLNCYLLLQLSASQLFVSIFISTNFFFSPNSSSEDSDLRC